MAYGAPIKLYQHTDRRDLKQPVDPTVLQMLQEDIAAWDPDEYLPSNTLIWCKQQQQDIGLIHLILHHAIILLSHSSQCI